MSRKYFSQNDILAMDVLYRRTFMNTLSGFKPAFLIGTTNGQGTHNLGTFNSIVHIGANPPHIGFIMRPLTVPRHTYSNIANTGHYTLNLITAGFVDKAHQCSAKYAQDESEFEATGLRPCFSESFPAPYVKEAPVKIGLRFAEKHHIASNDVWLIVGEVLEVIIEQDDIIQADGFLALHEAGGVSALGLDAYYEPKPLQRYAYARPQQKLKQLPFKQ